LVAWLAGRRLYSQFEDRLSVPADSAAAGAPASGATLFPSLSAAKQWLNGSGVTIDSLRSRPSVVFFWNDTRPSCLRILPLVQAWYDAYARYGLTVVGVYEPEFTFGADSILVAAAARRMHLTFPITLDPSLQLGRAFGAPPSLPRLVLFDAAGHAREQLDASGVEVMERAIRRELQSFRPALRFPADPVASASYGSPERRWPATVFLGASRVASGPLTSAPPGRERLFAPQFRYEVEGVPYTPYPVGLWKPTSEGVTAGRGGAENFIALRYDAGTLGAVMSPENGSTSRVWILRDEHWLEPEMLGTDVRVDGRGASYVDVDAPKLYELCRDSGGDHVVKLSPEKPGLTVHAITFEPVGEPPRP